MAYGIIKVDTVTFTNDGIDKSVSISGLVQNPTFSGNVTVTGTLSGVTVTGTTASFTSGVFTSISGATVVLTSGVFASGTAAAPSVSVGTTSNGIYSPGTNQLALSTNGTGWLFVDASGKVGIGTNSPAWNLHIASATNTFQTITSSTTTDAGLLLGDTDSSARGQVRYANTTDSMLLYTAGSEKLRITSAGLVGIGTSSPVHELDVAGVIRNNKVVSSATGDYTRVNAALISRGKGGSAVLLGVSNSNVPYIQAGTADADTGVKNLLLNPNGGNVGIGTTSPGQPLTIAGANPQIGLPDGAGNTATIGVAQGGGGIGNLTITGIASKNITFNSPSSEFARIDSSGRLLVGTSTSIAGTAGTAGQIQLHGASGAGSTQSVNNWSSSGGDPARLFIGKSVGGSVGTRGVVGSGAYLGLIRFAGDDGTNFIDAAQISAYTDGTPGTNDMPGRLVFSTTADGASSPTERMRITNDGRIICGNGAGNGSATTQIFVGGTAPSASNVTRSFATTATAPTTSTSEITSFYSQPSTADGIGAVSNLRHFFAGVGTITGGTRTAPVNQMGFLAESTLVGATNNFGFFSNIASGTNHWNFYANGTAANRFNGNVLIGGTQQPASATLALCLSNGTVPTGSITDGVVLYAEDVSSSSELKVRDEAGNVTTLSPHNFDLIPDGPSEDMAWSYYSERDGKRINVDMLKAIRLLEQLSGEKLVYLS